MVENLVCVFEKHGVMSDLSDGDWGEVLTNWFVTA